MISVTNAKNIIKDTVPRLAALQLPLLKASGLVLAAEVFAICDIPNFRQSSMDGYAVKYTEGITSYQVVGEMAAGSAQQLEIQPGQATRIFTGAALPHGADTVIIQEKVTVNEDRILVNDPQIKVFQHVREKGAEVKSGEVAMYAGTLLTPAAIGFLAGIGVVKVTVFPPPKVTIILTGNELQEPGKVLAFGQVYEANSFLLSAALRQAGIFDIQVLEAEDDLVVLQQVLNEALNSSDLILLTGGVSVGDYDFVVAATQHCGVKQAFHKIKQKPGKPLYFGSKDQKVVFGLPGNPSSVLSCFYQYVLLAIGKMLNKNLDLKSTTAVLTHDYKKASGLTHFLKGVYADGKVTPLHAQESFRLHSFAQANCLIVLAEEQGDYKAGDMVEVHHLPVS